MSHETKPASTVANWKGESTLSLSERYARAVTLVDESPLEAVTVLEEMHREIGRLALFSPNETLEDISTKSMPLLALEHFLAMALISSPTAPGKAAERKSSLLRSIDLWSAFLEKLETLEYLSPAERKEYHSLIDSTDGDEGTGKIHPPQMRREEKIARFTAKQEALKYVERMKSLDERRKRLGIPPEEVMDDTDEEGISRAIAGTTLSLAKADALEQWGQTLRELPMLNMMVEREREREQMDRHVGRQGQEASSSGMPGPMGNRPKAPAQGIQVTHITKDATTGKLVSRQEEIRSQVFRPGWIQPTMSLEEYAEREVAQAIEREKNQKISEADQMNAPRRYEDLVRDGMEDNSDLVDASAALDRRWDDFKDENPRGSGNKRGEQGDRNF